MVTKLRFDESIGNEVTVRWHRGWAALEYVVPYVCFLLLLRTRHVASVAHIKFLTLNYLGCACKWTTNGKTRMLFRKAARDPPSPPRPSVLFIVRRDAERKFLNIRILILQRSKMWLLFFVEGCQDTFVCRHPWCKISQYVTWFAISLRIASVKAPHVVRF